MIDRTNCKEEKETVYKTTTTHNHDLNAQRDNKTLHNRTFSTNRATSTAGAGTHTLTEKRSDSVIKGIIALLSFLALLWLAYGIISSTMNKTHHKDAAMQAPIVEENLNAPHLKSSETEAVKLNTPVSEPLRKETTTTTKKIIQ